MTVFTAEERARILKFRMGEIEVESIAELARRADVDRSNLARFLAGEDGVLGIALWSRVADALAMPREEMALLLGLGVVAVPVGIDLSEPEDEQLPARRAREASARRATRGDGPMTSVADKVEGGITKGGARCSRGRS